MVNDGQAMLNRLGTAGGRMELLSLVRAGPWLMSGDMVSLPIAFTLARPCVFARRIAWIGVAGAGLLSGCDDARPAKGTPQPLRQRAYVWQRDWNESVCAAVAEHGGEFSGLAVLGAQVSWELGDVKFVRPPVDWTVLARTGRPAGAVVRVERPVPAEAVPGLAALVTAEARRLMDSANAAGLTLAEVQVDYDSPQKKLADYAPWLRAVERGLEPVPVRITTLASWLTEAEFRVLIAAADGYILQVHSFDPPAPGQRAAVCDAGKTRAWVRQAAELGKPFHVALPTYRTTAGYDASGKLLGVATDGPAPEWPPGTVRQEFPSDAAALAGLVAEWQKERPAELEGIYWYRLPVTTDTRNWRWPALAAVMSGRAPLSKMEVKMSGTAPLDVVLSNSGEQDEWLPPRVTITWPGATPAAGDAVGGWSLAAEAGRAVFSPPSPSAARLLPAGKSTALGWLRFHEPAPPITDIHPLIDPPAPPAPPRDR